MSETHAPSINPVISRPIAGTFAAAWLVILILGFLGVQQFTNGEKQRNAQHWQRVLQLTAQSQRKQIEQWINAEQSVISGLATNTSLQLYMTELASGGEQADPAFTTFLSNLLISEAQQHGFTQPREVDAVAANVTRAIGAGIVMLDQRQAPLVRTASAPTLSQLPREVASAFRAQAASPIGPFLLNGQSYLLFHDSVSGVQSDQVQGYILGIKSIDSSLADMLALPPQAASTSESYLVRMDGSGVHYISSLADGTGPLTLSLDADTQSLAAAYVANNPGAFARMRDYLGQNVFAVGQPISNTDWTLVHKVDVKEAFFDMHRRTQAWLVGYVLLAGLLTAVMVAIWRNVSAARAKQTALHYQQLTASAEKQKSLLTHLTNTLIMLVDSRDPHAQHHSNGVALIASAIAEQMDLSERLRETTTLAASLMNVGKIKTSERLLAKKEITEEDRHSIRKSMLASADMLKNIAFDGPVVETLQQVLEHVDGSGPLGLREADIILPAKIIAVANAFVAMVSQRAYRDALSIDTALDEIHTSIDTLYARSVVAALQHYLENAGGRETWQRIIAARS